MNIENKKAEAVGQSISMSMSGSQYRDIDEMDLTVLAGIIKGGIATFRMGLNQIGDNISEFITGNKKKFDENTLPAPKRSTTPRAQTTAFLCAISHGKSLQTTGVLDPEFDKMMQIFKKSVINTINPSLAGTAWYSDPKLDDTRERSRLSALFFMISLVNELNELFKNKSQTKYVTLIEFLKLLTLSLKERIQTDEYKEFYEIRFPKLVESRSPKLHQFLEGWFKNQYKCNYSQFFMNLGWLSPELVRCWTFEEETIQQCIDYFNDTNPDKDKLDFKTSGLPLLMTIENDSERIITEADSDIDSTNPEDFIDIRDLEGAARGAVEKRKRDFPGEKNKDEEELRDFMRNLIEIYNSYEMPNEQFEIEMFSEYNCKTMNSIVLSCLTAAIVSYIKTGVLPNESLFGIDVNQTGMNGDMSRQRVFFQNFLELAVTNLNLLIVDNGCMYEHDPLGKRINDPSKMTSLQTFLNENLKKVYARATQEEVNKSNLSSSQTGFSQDTVQKLLGNIRGGLIRIRRSESESENMSQEEKDLVDNLLEVTAETNFDKIVEETQNEITTGCCASALLSDSCCTSEKSLYTCPTSSAAAGAGAAMAVTESDFNIEKYFTPIAADASSSMTMEDPKDAAFATSSMMENPKYAASSMTIEKTDEDEGLTDLKLAYRKPNLNPTSRALKLKPAAFASSNTNSNPNPFWGSNLEDNSQFDTRNQKVTLSTNQPLLSEPENQNKRTKLTQKEIELKKEITQISPEAEAFKQRVLQGQQQQKQPQQQQQQKPSVWTNINKVENPYVKKKRLENEKKYLTKKRIVSKSSNSKFGGRKTKNYKKVKRRITKKRRMVKRRTYKKH